MAAAAQSLEELAERANGQLDPMKTVRPLLDAARALFSECGVHQARKQLADALDAYAKAQAGVRAAVQAEAQTVDQYGDTLRQAEWDADDPARFVTEGNRTFLVDENGEKRQVTAEGRREWVKTQARKQAGVADAEAAAHEAGNVTADARDNLALAERRLQACRHDLDSTVAMLNTLTVALGKGIQIR